MFRGLLRYTRLERALNNIPSEIVGRTESGLF